MVQFKPNDFHGNAKMLCKHFGLEDESEVANLVSSFDIMIAGKTYSTEVGDGKYNSALFLLYLTEQVDSDEFMRSGQMRTLISAYFPSEVVAEAISDPETKHSTVRYLLEDGFVYIRINRPSRPQ